MKNSKVLARVAGLLYLVLAVCGGFAQLVARGAVYVPGDAAATGANIASNEGLLRAGLVADILMATLFVFLGLVLRRLFADLNSRLATAILVFVSVASGAILVNLVFHAGAMVVVADPTYLTAFGPEGRDALALLMLNLHNTGYLLGGVFFGLWLLPTGILAYRSTMFPKFVSVLILLGSLAWFVDTILAFALPESVQGLRVVPSTTSAVAEISLILYLLIVGVLRPKPAAVPVSA